MARDPVVRESLLQFSDNPVMTPYYVMNHFIFRSFFGDVNSIVDPVVIGVSSHCHQIYRLLLYFNYLRAFHKEAPAIHTMFRAEVTVIFYIEGRQAIVKNLEVKGVESFSEAAGDEYRVRDHVQSFNCKHIVFRLLLWRNLQVYIP